jgi:malonate-semialdehyde dehydrogenase (acetylating)/methylmalonate-semialdehyde dehydrogenase
MLLPVCVISRNLRCFRYQALIREHQEELAAIITKEQGKTLADARGDVFRWVLAPPAVLVRC